LLDSLLQETKTVTIIIIIPRRGLVQYIILLNTRILVTN